MKKSIKFLLGLLFLSFICFSPIHAEEYDQQKEIAQKIVSELTETDFFRDKCVAVVGLKDQSVNKITGECIYYNDLIIDRFVKIKSEYNLKVLSRDAIEKILTEYHFQLTDLADKDKVKKIGKALSADILVHGNINTKYSSIIVKAVNVATHDIFASSSLKTDTKDSTFNFSININPAVNGVIKVDKKEKIVERGNVSFYDIEPGELFIEFIPEEKEYKIVRKYYVVNKDSYELTIKLERTITPPVIAKENKNIKNDTYRKKYFTNSINMDFVWIQPGKFVMGSPSSEANRDFDEKLHEVKITRGFYMQRTEVTQRQYNVVMGDSHSYNGNDRPVVNVSWLMTYKFLKKLNNIQSEYIYSLPTEAQWEYCARAGTNTVYNWGDSADCNKANFGNGFRNECKSIKSGKIMDVKSYHPNNWGLYQMHGNVWEWCRDYYGVYPSGNVTDPIGPGTGNYRVYRGGSWYDDAGKCRSANRGKNNDSFMNPRLGFRLIAIQPG